MKTTKRKTTKIALRSKKLSTLKKEIESLIEQYGNGSVTLDWNGLKISYEVPLSKAEIATKLNKQNELITKKEKELEALKSKLKEMEDSVQ